MSNKIKLYEYDIAAYFTGNVIEIDETQGYQPGYLTTIPVPEIPEGHYARFNKSLQVWELTQNEAPVMKSVEEIIAETREILLSSASQEEPTVI